MSTCPLIKIGFTKSLFPQYTELWKRMGEWIAYVSRKDTDNVYLSL